MSRCSSWIAGASCLLLALPLAAQPVRVVPAPSGRSALALYETREGYRIEDQAGSSRRLPVPSGSRLYALDELATGWIAAGQRLVAEPGELVLLREESGEVAVVDAPGGRFGFRQQPVTLVGDGRFVGLAWLEGDDGEHNAVVAAQRTEDGWEAGHEVSPWLGDGQVGLVGAVLDDGSWLLVWMAGVDGGTSELMWSRFADGEWSPATRLHEENEVPDILPAVAPVPGGALVAWSRFDGHRYRLRLARLDGARWTDLGYLVEGDSLHPTVFPSPGGVGFLVGTAPRTWSLIEVNPAGRVTRRAVVEDQWIRPRVIGADGSAAIVRVVPPDGSPVAPVANSDLVVEWR